MWRKAPTSSRSAVLPSPEMPALLTRMSREWTWCAAAAMLAASVTSRTSSRAPPPDLLDGAFSARGVAGADPNGEAGGGELARDLPADALVGAGDQCS